MALKSKQLEFGPFRVDTANHQLFDRQKPIPLPPKAYDTLLYLLENADRLVTRDELMKAIWPDSFVEDGNLSVNIFQLRKVLGETADGRPYIETVPRRGYRFAVAVKTVDSGFSAAPHGGPVVLEPREDAQGKSLPGGAIDANPPFLRSEPGAGRSAAAARQPSAPEIIAFPEPQRAEHTLGSAPPSISKIHPEAESSRRIGYRRIWILAACLAVLGFLAGWLFWRGPKPGPQLAQRRLTSFAPEMAVTAAAISTGSKFVAYANPAGLYIQVIATGETHAISLPEAHFKVSAINWFPDSAELLVDGSSPSDAGPSMWIVPIIGAAPPVKLGPYPAGALSPRASRIAWIGHQAATPDIQVMPSHGGEISTVVTGNAGETFAGVSWSPTGRRLLFVRYRWNPQFRGNSGSIDLYDFSTHKVTTALSGNNLGGDAIKLRDGRIIYSNFSSSNPFSGTGMLMEIPTDRRTGAANGTPRAIARWNAPITDITVNSTGTRLALRDLVGQQNIYMADLLDGGARLDAVRQFSFGAGREDLPQAWSPDGKALFLDTNRNGNWEVYQRALASEAAAPLVSGPEDQFSPRVSPGGEWLLYVQRPVDWREPEPVRIMRVPVSGGLPQPVLTASHFSEWGLRFECPRSAGKPCLLAERQGNEVVFRAFDPVKGFEPPSGGVARIKAAGAIDWDVNPDGSRLAWISQNPAAAVVHVISLGGPSEAEKQHDVAIKGRSRLHSISWAPGGGWFLVSASQGSWSLLHASPQGKSHVLLAVSSNWPPDVFPSPDGRHLAFSERSFGSNVWLLAHF